jgi:Amt family ammonium transporter
MKKIRLYPVLLILMIFMTPAAVLAASSDTNSLESIKQELQTNINIVWTCIAAFLVFFMQAGFAMVETGFTRAKNAVNILMKNLMDFSIGSLAFFLVGFGLMFGVSNGLFGTTLFALSGTEPGTHWNWTFLIFQTVFAATAATIVSGAMAERTKFIAYLIYSAVISLVIYPIFGSWAWGGALLSNNNGWLAKLGFHDFAGSTVVHSIGGWLALAGAVMLGPRLGKYGPDDKPQAILGHNMALAALGVFILWFGWFGFNPGSTLTGNGQAGYIAVPLWP